MFRWSSGTPRTRVSGKPVFVEDAVMSYKGVYRLTRIPPVLCVHVKRVAAAEGHSIREVILRKLEEYVTTGFQHSKGMVAVPAAAETPSIQVELTDEEIRLLDAVMRRVRDR